MLRLTPGASSSLTQGLGGRLRPRPPYFESTRTGLRVGRYAAGAGASNLAQILAQRSLTGRTSNTTPPGKQSGWEAASTKSLVSTPLKRGRLATHKANSSTSLASNPWEAALTAPSCVHACKLAVRTSQSRRLIINTDVLIDGICLVLAHGAGEVKSAGHATQASAREAPDGVRVRAK